MQTEDTLERLYLLADLGMSQLPPGGVDESDLGEEGLDLPSQTVAPVNIQSMKKVEDIPEIMKQMHR